MNKKLALCVCAFLLAACGGKKDKEEPSKQTKVASETSQRPVYRVVTELVNIPLVVRDTKSQNINGFEMELLNAIAEKQGIVLDFNTVHTWQGIFGNLNNDRADIVAGAVTYSQERAQSMELTKPHLEYDFALLARSEWANASGFAAFRGKNIALKQKSIAETLIPIFGSPNESNIIRTVTTWEAIKAVMTGKADAAAGSSLVMEHYAAQYPNSNLVVVYDSSLPKKQYVFAVKKGNTALLNELNNGLARIKADGTYDAIYRKYWKK